jgi:WD40 repeat protein
MANEWHYSKNGKRFGPVSGQQLKELAAKGELGPSDLVWKEGMAQWVPASKIKGLLPSSSAVTNKPSPATPAALAKAGTATQPAKTADTPLDGSRLPRNGVGLSTRTKVLVGGGVAVVGLCLVGVVVAVSGWMIFGGKANPQPQGKGDGIKEQPGAADANNQRSWELVKQVSFPLKFSDSGKSLAYSPDGTHIAVLTAQQPAAIFEAASLQRKKDLGQNYGSAYSPITYSPKGNLLAWEGTKFVTLVDTSTYATVVEIDKHKSPTTANLFYHTYSSFSPDGNLFLTASDAGPATGSDSSDPQEQVALWDVRQKKLVARIPGRHPACFLPDGKSIVVSARAPISISLWDIATLKQTKVANITGTNPQSDSIKFLAPSPDGKLIAVVTEASDHRIHLMSLPAIEFKTSLVFAKKNSGFVRSIAFDKGGTRLAAVGGISVGAWKDDRSHGIAKVWHLPTMTVARILGHQGVIGSVTFDPNGRIATLGRDAIVRVWNERNDGKGACVYVSSKVDEQRIDPTADELADAYAQIVKNINDDIGSGGSGGKKGKSPAYNTGYQEGLALGNEYARRFQGMAAAGKKEFRSVYTKELRTHEQNRDEVIRAFGVENNNAQNKMGFCDGLREALQKAGII